MFNIAYDKETNKILGFIEADFEINPDEVFKNYKNYHVIKTKKRPPIINYDNHIIHFDNEEITYVEIKEELSEEETLKEAIRQKQKELQESNQILLDFLEGELTVSEYAETKKQRQNIRKEIKEMEKQIQKLKGASDG